ncbi:tetratricopeptide repeat protein [Candidatus Avelusimicrobium aviculae]|uniref:tetratricopeptide repeat protein n=1 Tax=Candidatus Avelusimicrobium aviculae TaxID=3416206 RepID=UPI003D104F79
MKKHFLFVLFALTALSSVAAPVLREIPVRQHGKEAGMLLDLSKISLGTLNDVEERKQYLSTVQLEKQRIQNYTLRMVYENAYQLYKQGDYQRAQELAQTILSIDPNFTQAQTLALQANHMGTYGTVSESQVIEAKFQEALRLYDSGRLVEANQKLDEILTIRPGNSKALSWKKKITADIAAEYVRRGDRAYDSGDYQKALDNWYNALMIRKDDASLVTKISQTENVVRKQQVQEYMEKAMAYYNQGQYVEAYSVFERIIKIQPGDQRVQKYMMQLKDEIYDGYANAGSKAYGVGKYDSAIAYWTKAKKWGSNTAEMDSWIKKARNAKENALRIAQEKKFRSVKRTKDAQGNIVEEVIESTTVTTQPEVKPEPTEPLPETVGVNETLPELAPTTGRVSEEARAASRQKYVEGLDAFTQDDYERARAAWVQAVQLDPGNSDAAIGLQKVEELTGIR